MIRSNIQINDNGFIFSQDLGMTYTANHTGVEILKLMQQGFNREKIKATITKAFSISETEFEKDYQDFSVQLKNLKLLV